MQDLERTEKDQNPRERRQKKQTSVFSVGFSKNLEISQMGFTRSRFSPKFSIRVYTQNKKEENFGGIEILPFCSKKRVLAKIVLEEFSKFKLM